MKFVILVLVILLASSLVLASHPDSINEYPGLVNFIEKSLGNHDVKLVPLEYTRTIKDEPDLIVISLNIKYPEINFLLQVILL